MLKNDKTDCFCPSFKSTDKSNHPSFKSITQNMKEAALFQGDSQVLRLSYVESMKIDCFRPSFKTIDQRNHPQCFVLDVTIGISGKTKFSKLVKQLFHSLYPFLHIFTSSIPAYCHIMNCFVKAENFHHKLKEHVHIPF